MEIDYSQIDPASHNIVRIIESKPHVRYIRYLMTKRYSPIVIKKELQRLALSAPHEEQLIKYYLAVMDPMVKKYGLGEVYASYKGKLFRKNVRYDFAKHYLKYRLEFQDKPGLQEKFCKFITELEVDIVWVSEIMSYYGVVANVPLDANGNRIIKTGSHNRKLDAILTNPKRYLIDKMLLENVPDQRIADYVRKEFKISCYSYDIEQYKKIFFNMQTYDIEGKIKALEVERESLNNFFSVIDNDHELGLGEKIAMKAQTEQRIKELDDSVKTLNAMFTEFAFKQAHVDRDDFMEMFQEVVHRSYKRFESLDKYSDRDVVDPLFKVAKMMGYAYEKVNDISVQKQGSSDKHAQFELMKLYQQRSEELYDQQSADMTRKIDEAGENIIDDDIDRSEILGTDELNIMHDEFDEPEA